MDWNTCRLCNQSDASTNLVKYGTRHYAHARCALTRWGAAFFGRLSLFALEQFPAIAAAEAGVYEDLKRAIATERVRLGGK